MAVIVGMAGRQLPAPVQREAQFLELRLHIGDIFVGPFAGMDILFHRGVFGGHAEGRSEEHTSELQSLMRISYAVFCLKKKKKKKTYYYMKTVYITTRTQ